jgi:NitT/TauT family transport system substrate-binding protein
LNYLLARRNVDLAAVSVVGVGHTATALAAVESGKVDAAILTEPGLAALFQREPKLRLLADTRTREGVEELFNAPQFPASVLYAKQEWLDQNKATAAKLTRAMRATLIWMLGHTAAQIAGKMPPEHVGADRRLYEEALIAAMPIFNPDGAISMEGAEAVRKVLSYSVPAVRQQAIDLSRTFTNEFVEADLIR